MENNTNSEKFKNGKYIYDIIAEIVNATGPRFPTTEEEKYGAELLAKKMENELGVKAISEPFKCAPKASIGFVPCLGWIGFAALVAFYLTPIAGLILACTALIFAVFQVFTYSGILDVFFKKRPSQNVYATVPSKTEKPAFTIMLSGHIDSSWCWKLSLKNPKTMALKTVMGILAVSLIAIVSLVLIIFGATSVMFIPNEVFKNGSVNITYLILYLLPILSIPGCYWLSNYMTWKKSMGSPGAMDNMSGCAVAISVNKYFNEHPEEKPDNVRIISCGHGCEEAGLKGSEAFCKAHKDDKEFFNEHLYVINLDSFRDGDHFEAIKEDTWLFSKFDEDLINMTLDSIEEQGIKSNCIPNPVGGCDSTPYYRSNVRTVTIAAQDPRPTNYYHTPNDRLDGLSLEVLDQAHDIIVRLCKKIFEFEKNNQEPYHRTTGENFTRKK